MVKVDIGKFYIAIDQHLKRKGSRPDSIYQFIENVVASSKASTDTITYGKDYTMNSLQTEVKSLTIQLQEKEEELKALREEMGVINKEYKSVTEIITQQQKKYATKLSVSKENDLACENSFFENFRLATLVEDLQKEILTQKVDSLYSTENENSIAFCFQTMDNGKRYSPAIRELYYTLLADQVPPAKASKIVRAVLKCFIPSVNMDNLKLPSEGCAGYMRRQELNTVSMAHKATLITEQVALTEMLCLNSDGTTKSQKKINGVALNGLTISVNGVADGSADRIVEDISKEFKNLRDMVRAL